MNGNILIGSAIIIFTSFIHSGLTRGVYVLVKWGGPLTSLRRLLLIDAIVLLIVFFSLVESTVWAIYFYSMATFPSFEESLYFSLVTFTTLGYGDVTLPVGYRLLGALEAANGIIIFGWSTALVISAIQKLQFSSSQ